MILCRTCGGRWPNSRRMYSWESGQTPSGCEVRAPHDVVLADLVEHLDTDAIALIGGEALPPPILARLHFQIEILELVLPFEIHAIENVGEPANPALADDELQLWMMLEHARENHRHQHLSHVHLEARDGGREGCAAGLRRDLADVGQSVADRMEVDRQLNRGHSVPDRVPPRIPERVHRVAMSNVEAAQSAIPGDAFDLRDRVVGTVAGDTGQPGVAVGMCAAEAGEPFVVDAEHLGRGLFVIRSEEHTSELQSP